MNVCDATKLVYGSVFKTDLASERKKTVARFFRRGFSYK